MNCPPRRCSIRRARPGNPKGVLYSHRSDVLHCLSITGVYSMGLAPTDTILPMTPMFHATGRGDSPMPHRWSAAKLVLPGPKMDAASIAELIEDRGRHGHGRRPDAVFEAASAFRGAGPGSGGTMQRLVVAGSAPAPSMIEGFERLGVSVNHVWGMTETQSVRNGNPAVAQDGAGVARGTASPQDPCRARRSMVSTSRSPTRLATRCRMTASRAGASWCAGRGFSAAITREEKPLLEDGWFNTGDLAVMDDDSYIQLTDRAKDVIKSGGEWISRSM